MPAGFLDARVKDDEVVNQLEKATLTADKAQVIVEEVGIRILNVLFPFQKVFFRSFNHSIADALGIIAGHHQLNRGEEVADEIFFLIIEVLANPFRDGN